MGVLDFHPSTDVGLVYLTEADLVEGDTYKSKLNKLTKVLLGGKQEGGSVSIVFPYSPTVNSSLPV